MVFSSVPLFLDPPNWHLQSPNDESHRAAQQAMPAVAAAATSSMTERARVAKIAAPEGPLKCPRCDSSNTKFCYFNNYSLTQPRHFCKTCRRYWTRGGSLRNVPVGGGCRRNKRKRSSARRPRSPTAAQQPPHPALDEFMAPTTSQPFSFMASLHSLMTSSQQVGLGGFGSGGNNNNNNNSQSHCYELPNLLGGGGRFGASSYPFQNSTNNNNMEGILETASFGKGFLGGFPHHLKMEEAAAARQLNLLSKQFVTDDTQTQTQHPHPLFWSNGNGNSINHAGLWTDLSGISSSSSTTPTPLNTTIMR